MIKGHARRFMLSAALLAAFGLVFWTGCSKDLMSPDDQPPTGSQITNPVDGSSLNDQVINVRGRAEVGATIDIYVNDELQGSGVSSPAVPADGLGGRFTAERINLGEEGEKHIVAVVTDLYGNVATQANTPSVTITLDQTAPPVLFECVTAGGDTLELVPEPGEWGDGYYETGQPEIIVQGKTDVSASGARMRYMDKDFQSGEFEQVPDEPDGRRFFITIPLPRLTGGSTDTLIIYRLEAYDDAGNVAFEPVPVHWEIQAREEELKNDDGTADSIDDVVTGNPGQKIAVRFQAPTWANYVTKIIYYIANDRRDNPDHPDQPSTLPFTSYIWRVTLPDSLPSTAPANDGFVPYPEPYSYPEDAWVTATLRNPVNITNNDQFPDRKFFAGLEWEYRLNPYLYEDAASPTNTLNYDSYYWDYYNWVLRLNVDTMIRAVVSDVPSIDGGREAILQPMRS
ncbi:MAG: hypothetical protein JXB46_01670 [Candidatus Eisenbacteria bacterium]|nr:hypothetical protein [Candidatus Eisenbacteria bacterium]